MKDILVYGVATGSIGRGSDTAVEVIRQQEGLLGVHPVKGYGLLWIFDTLNHAKVARNEMKFAGIQTGKNISEVYIDDKYLK